MKKMYNTIQKKQDKNKMKIKIDWSKIPNKMHLEAQIKYPVIIQEDKRRKKPKYKKDLFKED